MPSTIPIELVTQALIARSMSTMLSCQGQRQERSSERDCASEVGFRVVQIFNKNTKENFLKRRPMKKVTDWSKSGSDIDFGTFFGLASGHI